MAYQYNSTHIDRLKKIEIPLLLLAFILPIPLSFLARQAGYSIHMSTAIIISVFHNVGMMVLVLHFLRRNGEPLTAIGLSRQNFQKELIRGMFLFLPVLMTIGLLAQLLRCAGLPVTTNPMQVVMSELGSTEIAGMIGLMVIIAIAEEIVFRGYLIQRLRLISGNTPVAIVLSSVLFALGHAYQGAIALVVILSLGIILGAIYILTKSLVAPMTIHFLNNSLAILLWSLIDSADLYTS